MDYQRKTNMRKTIIWSIVGFFALMTAITNREYEDEPTADRRSLGGIDHEIL